MKIKQRDQALTCIEADETGLRINKRLQYVHVASNATANALRGGFSWGRTAIDEINVLPLYRGRASATGCSPTPITIRRRHALCDVHLLRELIYFEEVAAEQKQWARPLKSCC